jgi:hypothetical protein
MFQSKELPEIIKEQLIIQEFTQSDASKNLNSSLDLKTGNTKFVNVCWGRGLDWSKIRAWGVRGPGFKSPRPHHF